MVIYQRLQVRCAYVQVRLDDGIPMENMSFDLLFHFLSAVCLKRDIAGLCLHEADAIKNAVCVSMLY